TDEVAELEVTQNDICKTLTGNLVKAWPKKNNQPATKLTAKYALLNKIAAVNWVSTTHSNNVATGLSKFIYVVGTRTPFDFGSYIFEQTILHGKTLAVKMPIAFPTLLCDIILAQHPGICTDSDMPSRRESDLSLDYRLFEGTHAADIAPPSSKKSTSPSI
ncbi:envelope-like protein, partial [Trifolium medium]|nr:envelope-like protein [Trifolium medium]